VVRQVTEGEQSGELTWNKRDHDLFCVDLRNDSRDRAADFELVCGNGSRKGLLDGNEDLLGRRIEINDSHVHRLANEEDIGEVGDKVLTVKSVAARHYTPRDPPCFRLRYECPQATKQINQTPLVQQLGDNSGRDLPDLDIGKTGRDLECRIHKTLLERQEESVPKRLERKHSSLHRRADLEPFLGVLEPNVGIMVWPHYTIHATGDIDEETLVRKAADRTLIIVNILLQ
jgi:hypothetical protein